MAASVGENKGHKRAAFRPKNDTGTKFLMPSCLYIVNLCFKYKKIYMKNSAKVSQILLIFVHEFHHENKRKDIMLYTVGKEIYSSTKINQPIFLKN